MRFQVIKLDLGGFVYHKVIGIYKQSTAND